MKLYEMLFESSVTSNKVIDALEEAISENESNTTSEAIQFALPSKKSEDYGYPIADPYYSPRAAAELLYTSNKPVFDRILSDATEITVAGVGTFGFAFSLGDKILKIEAVTNSPASSDKRITLSTQQLWGNEQAGKLVPMIYDSGTMKYRDVKLFWAVLEKFETIPEGQRVFMDDVLEAIVYRNEVIDEDTQQEVAEALRLSDNWLEQFEADISKLEQAGINLDVHAGNVGIRRQGGEGYLVVFD